MKNINLVRYCCISTSSPRSASSVSLSKHHQPTRAVIRNCAIYTEEKEPLWKHRRRWDDNIKVDLKGI
jgi:hypothetical protein